MDTFLAASMAGIAFLTPLLSFAKAGLGLGFVIFVHELGHFLAAKACGVKCEKFYVGFDVPIKIGPIQFPRALFRKKWGETEYGIGVVPLGGYVKMLGQDDNPANAAQEAERIRIGRDKAAKGENTDDFDLDPRSYPAKSVPKRMIIISAGVIMNLLFAAIFATAAYYFGVEYEPCVVGQLEPGTPAWESNKLQPSDKIIQLGRKGNPSEYLRFDHDLLQFVGLSNGQPVDLLVRRGNDEPHWVTITPREAGEGAMSHYQLGINRMISAKISDANATLPGSAANVQAKQFEGGGTVVAIEAEGTRHPVRNFSDIARLMSQFRDKQVVYWIERPAPETASGSEKPATKTVSITVDPNPQRDLGIDFTPGPIVAVRADSPAATAGLKKGDIITAVNGEPIRGALSLPEQLAKLDGQDVELQVSNKDAADEAPKTIVVRPVTPQTTLPSFQANDQIPVHALGIVIESDLKLDTVDEKASDAGLKPGDIIKAFQFKLAESQTQDQDAKTLEDYHLPTSEIQLGADEDYGVATFDRILQHAPAGMLVVLKYERDGVPEQTTLTVELSDSRFQPVRGVLMQSEFAIRTASSFSEAASLGIRETVESVGKVFVFLRKLVTREVKMTNIGGPLSILAITTSHASSGIPRLLILLTLISANLAVLNFLPIPVLDGGHMMFLLYEGVFGKPMNDRLAFFLTLVGFSFILMLMAVAFGMDLYRAPAFFKMFGQ